MPGIYEGQIDGTSTLTGAIPAGTNIIGKVGIDQTTPGTTNGVQVNAALPAGNNNIGDVDVASLPALPAGTNNIGDVDVLSLPALPAGGNVIGEVGVTELPAAAALADASANPTTTTVGAVQLGVGGTATYDRLRVPNVVKAFDATAVAAETTVWTPAGGKKFRLMGYHLAASVAGNIILRDNTAGTVIAVIPSGAGGSGVHVDLGNGVLSAAANNVLTAQGPAASTLSGVIYGIEE